MHTKFPRIDKLYEINSIQYITLKYELTVKVKKIIITYVDWSKPIKSITTPPTTGPTRAPKEYTLVKIPEIKPWVLRSFGYPCALYI